MDIIFKNSKFRKECNSLKELIRRHGERRGKLIGRRLDEMNAATVLEELRTLPQARCHELRQNRKGQLAVDLDGPYRLIFEPANNPIPRTPDGGLDWTKVTAVRILEIEDYHE